MPALLPEMTAADATKLDDLECEGEVHTKSFKRNASSRDWMLRVGQTQHTPEGEEITITPATVKEIFSDATALIFQLEKGKKHGYMHYQAFVRFETPRRFSTIRKRFTTRGLIPNYCEPRQYSIQSCVTYCSKEDTRVEGPWQVGSFETTPTKQATYQECIEALDTGSTIQDLLTDDKTKAVASQKLPALKAIESAKMLEMAQQEREVEAFYLWGPPRTGKTYSVTHLRHDPTECYLYNSNDAHPWDSYTGQSILVLDEFQSQPEFHSLCTWLEGYPCQLPARYSSKWALWSEVWIISNASLEDCINTYRRKKIPESMLGSLPGRIKTVIHRTSKGETVHQTPEYMQLQAEIESIKAIPLAEL